MNDTGIRPRMTLVLVKLFKQKTGQVVGKIHIPNSEQEFCHGKVLAVGPGTVAAEGGVSETADLKEGDIVMVRHQRKGQQLGSYQSEGMEIGKGKRTYLFEQTNILAVVPNATVEYDTEDELIDTSSQIEDSPLIINNEFPRRAD